MNPDVDPSYIQATKWQDEGLALRRFLGTTVLEWGKNVAIGSALTPAPAAGCSS